MKMQIRTFLQFITSLLTVSLGLCTNNSQACINPNFSISQSVVNEGFHRDINWLIESLDGNTEKWNKSNCRVSLRLDVPSGIFVNPDQISELARLGQISAYITGDVDIETPAHESEGHIVYVFIPTSNLKKVAVQLPIHLRYQRAVISGGFGKVNLPKPYFLIYCPEDEPLMCNEYPKVEAPCDMAGNTLCSWQNITYHPLFEEVQLFVPIGDLDDYPLVSIITLLLGCAGSIYVLSLLSAAPL